MSHAIELSAKLLRFYTGKGAIPYGDHAAWTETHEDNGKCGMAAVLFNQRVKQRVLTSLHAWLWHHMGTNETVGIPATISTCCGLTCDRAKRAAGHRCMDAGIRWLVS